MYEKVLQYCDEVLQLSPNNAKAMYRKGVALYNLSRLDDALEELLKAQQQPAGMKGNITGKSLHLPFSCTEFKYINAMLYILPVHLSVQLQYVINI